MLMHNVMMTSSPPAEYLTEKCMNFVADFMRFREKVTRMRVINGEKAIAGREKAIGGEKSKKPTQSSSDFRALLTLDAGPNPHLLFDPRERQTLFDWLRRRTDWIQILESAADCRGGTTHNKYSGGTLMGGTNDILERDPAERISQKCKRLVAVMNHSIREHAMLKGQYSFGETQDKSLAAPALLSTPLQGLQMKRFRCNAVLISGKRYAGKSWVASQLRKVLASQLRKVIGTNRDGATSDGANSDDYHEVPEFCISRRIKLSYGKQKALEDDKTNNKFNNSDDKLNNRRTDTNTLEDDNNRRTDTNTLASQILADRSVKEKHRGEMIEFMKNKMQKDRFHWDKLVWDDIVQHCQRVKHMEWLDGSYSGNSIGNNIQRKEGEGSYSSTSSAPTISAPLIVLSDLRRPNDLEFFRKVSNCVHIRVQSGLREKRGWVYDASIDEGDSECGLDDSALWDLVFQNDFGEDFEETSESPKPTPCTQAVEKLGGQILEKLARG
jgi:hypothetical protein